MANMALILGFVSKVLEDELVGYITVCLLCKLLNIS